MGHLTHPEDVARTDPDAEADRTALLVSARGRLSGAYEGMTPAQRREFDAIILLGLHCAENLTGPALSSDDVDTYLYDPLTGLPR